jgi:hypothetical protein
MRNLAGLLGGKTFDESDVGGAVQAVQGMIGNGPLENVGVAERVRPLARWFTIAAFIPLAFLLWRRILA